MSLNEDGEEDPDEHNPPLGLPPSSSPPPPPILPFHPKSIQVYHWVLLGKSVKELEEAIQTKVFVFCFFLLFLFCFIFFFSFLFIIFLDHLFFRDPVLFFTLTQRFHSFLFSFSSLLFLFFFFFFSYPSFSLQEKNQTPLHIACEEGRKDVVSCLLKHINLEKNTSLFSLFASSHHVPSSSSPYHSPPSSPSSSPLASPEAPNPSSPLTLPPPSLSPLFPPSLLPSSHSPSLSLPPSLPPSALALSFAFLTAGDLRTTLVFIHFISF